MIARALFALLVACGGPTPADGGTDAGSDAGFDAGSASDAGVDGGLDAGTPCQGPPGLYAPGSCTELAPGVRAYRPRYELWSDDADKERFVYLPPGTQIDTSDPDRWVFPQGTIFFKTFSLGEMRLETRILQKVAASAEPASWTMTTYAWSADQQTTTLVDPVLGAQNVLGTQHDIPRQGECVRCHSITQADAVNGFQALQLNHAEGGVTLATLIDESLLAASNVTLDNATFPGDAATQAALGYLHANCGHCHGGPKPQEGLALWSRVGVTDPANEPVFETAICRCSVWTGTGPGGELLNLRIAPGHSELSTAVVRMGRRVPLEQMPPLGTEVVDPAGMAILATWIDSLDETTNGCPRTCP